MEDFLSKKWSQSNLQNIQEILKKKQRKPSTQVEKWLAVKETSGRNSKCRGCRKAIKAGELHIQHTHKQQPNDKHLTTHQFHVKPGCLWNINEKHMKSFLEKKWSQKSIRQTQRTVRKMWTETDSDTDNDKDDDNNKGYE